MRRPFEKTYCALDCQKTWSCGVKAKNATGLFGMQAGCYWKKLLHLASNYRKKFSNQNSLNSASVVATGVPFKTLANPNILLCTIVSWRANLALNVQNVAFRPKIIVLSDAKTVKPSLCVSK
jgi:hypothetical protein